MVRRARRSQPSRICLTAVCVVVLVGLPAQATAQDPSVGGYAGQGPETQDALDQAPNLPTRDVGGGLPATAPGGSRPSASPATGTLPFTGLQVVMMAALGVALVALGFVIRREQDRTA